VREEQAQTKTRLGQAKLSSLLNGSAKRKGTSSGRGRLSEEEVKEKWCPLDSALDSVFNPVEGARGVPREWSGKKRHTATSMWPAGKVIDVRPERRFIAHEIEVIQQQKDVTFGRCQREGRRSLTVGVVETGCFQK